MCCLAVAMVKQALQTQMDEWRAHASTLTDQILAVDPHYVPGAAADTMSLRLPSSLASYADIVAGRSTPNSRSTSPCRGGGGAQQLDELHQPTFEQLIPSTSNVEPPPRSASEESRIPIDINKRRRGRSPTKRTTVIKNKDQVKVAKKSCSSPVKISVTQVSEDLSKSVESKPAMVKVLKQSGELTVNNAERRNRSPSPMWLPGSASYADILRGSSQGPPSRQRSPSSRSQSSEMSHLIPLKSITYSKVHSEKSPKIESDVDESVVPPPPPPVMADAPPSEKPTRQVELSKESENWKSEQVQQSFSAVPVARQSVYDYIQPALPTELVGYINAQLGSYPAAVGSYVYAPQQIQQQIDTIPLAYEEHINYSTEQHYVTAAPTGYLAAQQGVYQPEQNIVQCTTRVILQPSDVTPTSFTASDERQVTSMDVVDHAAAPKVSENVIIAESPVKVMLDIEKIDVQQQSDASGSSFSYAQILSQGLSHQVPSVSKSPTREAKRRSASPREKSPCKKLLVEVASATKIDDAKEPLSDAKTDWDTIKRRDAKKKTSVEPKSKLHVQENEKTSGAEQSKNKPQERRNAKDKVDKKQTTEGAKGNKIEGANKVPEIVAMRVASDVSARDNSSLEEMTDKSEASQGKNKRKQKKRKGENHGVDEIDKALREIEDMDKQQKTKAKKDKVIEPEVKHPEKKQQKDSTKLEPIPVAEVKQVQKREECKKMDELDKALREIELMDKQQTKTKAKKEKAVDSKLETTITETSVKQISEQPVAKVEKTEIKTDSIGNSGKKGNKKQKVQNEPTEIKSEKKEKSSEIKTETATQGLVSAEINTADQSKQESTKEQIKSSPILEKSEISEDNKSSSDYCAEASKKNKKSGKKADQKNQSTIKSNEQPKETKVEPGKIESLPVKIDNKSELVPIIPEEKESKKFIKQESCKKDKKLKEAQSESPKENIERAVEATEGVKKIPSEEKTSKKIDEKTVKSDSEEKSSAPPKEATDVKPEIEGKTECNKGKSQGKKDQTKTSVATSESAVENIKKDGKQNKNQTPESVKVEILASEPKQQKQELPAIIENIQSVQKEEKIPVSEVLSAPSNDKISSDEEKSLKVDEKSCKLSEELKPTILTADKKAEIPPKPRQPIKVAETVETSKGKDSKGAKSKSGSNDSKKSDKIEVSSANKQKDQNEILKPATISEIIPEIRKEREIETEKKVNINVEKQKDISTIVVEPATISEFIKEAVINQSIAPKEDSKIQATQETPSKKSSVKKEETSKKQKSTVKQSEPAKLPETKQEKVVTKPAENKSTPTPKQEESLKKVEPAKTTQETPVNKPSDKKEEVTKKSSSETHKPATTFHEKLQEEIVFTNQCDKSVKSKGKSPKPQPIQVESKKESTEPIKPMSPKTKEVKRETDESKPPKQDNKTAKVESKKETELVQLVPATVEATLTSTYALPTASAKSEEMILTLDEGDSKAPLFGSVKDRKKGNKKVIVEQPKLVEGEKNKKIQRADSFSEGSEEELTSAESQSLPTDLIKDYWINYHDYNNAETHLHEHYKIVKIVEDPNEELSKDVVIIDEQEVAPASTNINSQGNNTDKTTIMIPASNESGSGNNSKTVHLVADDDWMLVLDGDFELTSDFDEPDEEKAKTNDEKPSAHPQIVVLSTPEDCNIAKEQQPQPLQEGQLMARERKKSGSHHLTHSCSDEGFRPRVQFYINDELVSIKPSKDKESPSKSPNEEMDSSWVAFVPLDQSFWLDKQLYHEAERDLFENLASVKPKVSSENDEESTESGKKDDDDDSNGDNSSGGGGGSGDNNAKGSLAGAPRTERLIADLPGGIGCWSDYSTYLDIERVDDKSYCTTTAEQNNDPNSQFLLQSNPKSNLGNESQGSEQQQFSYTGEPVGLTEDIEMVQAKRIKVRPQIRTNKKKKAVLNQKKQSL